VEQATHFVDLGRHLVGEARLDSVRATAVPGDGPLATLSDTPAGEDGRPIDAAVPPAFRHPRATCATWRFESGAVGSLSHATLLHGERYEAELDVWCDGLRLRLTDPYGTPRLLVREAGSEQEESMSFAGDDPYLSENQAFVDAVRRRDPSGIRSPYADAFRTHELAWAITAAAR
jgi:predicted dehydrogenase